MAMVPAQGQQLVSQNTTVDVGATGYEQPITAVFRFQNASTEKLKIQAVHPDCYCTKVVYPQGEVDGLADFEIKMTYDARQLGHFNKQAAVISNGSAKPIYICMQGVVLADIMDYSGNYPVDMGEVLVDKNELVFDDINLGDQQVQELHIYNNSTQMCRPNLMHLPSYLTATMTPERLAPRKSGTFTVTLNSRLLHDYGLTQSTLYIAANPGDVVSPDHEVSVSAILLPSFAGISSSQMQYVPKIQLSKETVELVFDNKKTKKEVILISNTGRTELNISSLQLFTGGLEVSLNKSRLKPGDTAKLKIKAYREQLKKLKTKPRILMITNDPAKPKIMIHINAK